ncbi:phosphopantetheine-binding protein [Kitasatospora sp. NPDC058218]|uniref:phosphopantetheine-binding protein n=1 Tax=Kitasatospora sp. NPDC058218 TaxID=3346385 RepID=UPI0036DDCF3F
MTDTDRTGSAAVLDAESIRADIAELLGEEPEAVGDDDDLRDLGLDSMRLMHLIERWRARGARVEFADLADLGAPTVRVWSAYLSAA